MFAKHQKHDDDEHAKRRILNTLHILSISQYNIRNNKKNIMISLLIDFKIKQYNVLVIQKS